MEDIKTNYQKYHSHISSKHKWYDLKLKEVWQYKDLIWLFTKRSFVVTYKQTVLGPAWLFLNPIITSFIYAFVFGGIAGMGTDGIPSILFYLTSTAIWTFFSGCLTKNASTFTANAAVFGKVYFPRLTIPISNVLSSIIQFFIQFAMVMAFLVFCDYRSGFSKLVGVFFDSVSIDTSWRHGNGIRYYYFKHDYKI